MKMRWSNAELCIRPEGEQEEEWLTQFGDMLEGAKFVFEPPPTPRSDTDDQETVPVFD